MTDTDTSSTETPSTETEGTTADQPTVSQKVDPKLLEILVCPLTKASLSYDDTKQELISREARLAYPIREGIPIMLPDEARTLEDSELA